MQARQAYILDVSDRVTVVDVAPSTIRVEVNAGKRQGIDLVLMGPHALALRDRLNKLMPPAPELLGHLPPKKWRRSVSTAMSQDERLRRMAETPGGKAVMAALVELKDWSRADAIAAQANMNPNSVRPHLYAFSKTGLIEKRHVPSESGRGSAPVEWRVKPAG